MMALFCVPTSGQRVILGSLQGCSSGTCYTAVSAVSTFLRRSTTPIYSNHTLSLRFLSFRGRKRPPSGRRRKDKPPTAPLTGETTSATPYAANLIKGGDATSTNVSALDRTEKFKHFLRQWVVPVRYRFPGDAQFYTREQGFSLAYRIPLFVALAALLSWDETAPVSLIRIRGPSMLPTMAADGSDVWLCSTYVWRKRFGFLPSYQRGDLVGFSHPHHPDVISCKRIVGVAGDRVQRYGQYVHLYTDQDPVNLGLTWPTDAAHAWIDPNCPWDDTGKQLDLPNNINKQLEAKRTIVVPDGHVWVEADCPALGIDSRQFGPIPVEWLQGKIVAQLWPFWRTTNRASVWDKRPHPIPLDTETLMEHNVYRLEVNQG